MENDKKKDLEDLLNCLVCNIEGGNYEIVTGTLQTIAFIIRNSSGKFFKIEYILLILVHYYLYY